MIKHYRCPIKIVVVCFLITSLQTVFAQYRFYKTYGVTQTYSYISNTVCKAYGNGYIAAGQRYTTATGSSDVCMMHISDTGAVVWSKTYGGSNDDVAWDVRQTRDGNYIMAGSTKSVNGAFDMYVIKFDTAGDVLQSATVGGSNLDIAYCIIPTTDSGYVLTGRTQSFGAGNEEFYLVKLNSALAVQWSRTVGNTNPDYSSWAEELNDGSIIACGYTLTLNSSWDMLLVKTDSAGNVLWKKNYGTAAEGEYARVVKATADGGFIMGGDQNDAGASIRKALITKVNSAGSVQWCKSFTASSFSSISGMIADSTGYTFTGYMVSNGQTEILIIKTDFNGDTLFTKALGSAASNDSGEKIIPANDGSYVFTGYISFVGNYGNDFFLMKTDSLGETGCYSSPTGFTVNNVTLTSANFGTNGSGAASVNFTSQGVNATVTDTSFCSSIISSVHRYNQQNTVKVSPNPFLNEVSISINNFNTHAQYFVYDIRGQMHESGNINSAITLIQLGHLPEGVYFIRVIAAEFSVVSKLIKT